MFNELDKGTQKSSPCRAWTATTTAITPSISLKLDTNISADWPLLCSPGAKPLVASSEARVQPEGVFPSPSAASWPAVEARQQRLTLARLLVALRIPADDTTNRDRTGRHLRSLSDGSGGFTGAAQISGAGYNHQKRVGSSCHLQVAPDPGDETFNVMRVHQWRDEHRSTISQWFAICSG